MSGVLMPGYARGRLCHACGRAPYALGMFCAACGAGAPQRMPAIRTFLEDDEYCRMDGLLPGDFVESALGYEGILIGIRVWVNHKLVATETFKWPETASLALDRVVRLLPHARDLSIDFATVMRAVRSAVDRSHPVSPRSPDPWYEVTWDDAHLAYRASLYVHNRRLYGRYFHTETQARAWATQEIHQLRNTSE